MNKTMSHKRDLKDQKYIHTHKTKQNKQNQSNISACRIVVILTL